MKKIIFSEKNWYIESNKCYSYASSTSSKESTSSAQIGNWFGGRSSGVPDLSLRSTSST